LTILIMLLFFKYSFLFFPTFPPFPWKFLGEAYIIIIGSQRQTLKIQMKNN
jgi:hypothetical protein